MFDRVLDTPLYSAHRQSFFIINFEDIQEIKLAPLSLTLNMTLSLGSLTLS